MPLAVLAAHPAGTSRFRPGRGLTRPLIGLPNGSAPAARSRSATTCSISHHASRGRRAQSSEVELIAWMMGLQLAFGLVLALLAAWQLRPIFRRQDAERRHPGNSSDSFAPARSRMRHAAAGQESIRQSRSPEPACLAYPRRRLLRSPRPRQSSHALERAIHRSPWRACQVRRISADGDRRWLSRLLHVLAGFTWQSTKSGILELPRRTNYAAWANRIAFMWFLHGVVPLVYIDRHPGRGRRRGGIDHLRARGRYLGQPDGHRSDRPRDHLCQNLRCDETRAEFLVA